MIELNKRIRDIAIPERLRGAPLSPEGYPVPWFVPWLDGVPEFRAMDGEKFVAAVRRRLCWLCGQPLGKHLCFPIGPMCAVTRTTAEPPSHLSCAEYAVKVCPFLTQPRMRRNEKDMPEEKYSPGEMIKRNPGVTVLWTTLGFNLFRDGDRGYLFSVGDPEHVEVYAEGRTATIEELVASVSSGYPLLEAIAIQEEGGQEELRRQLAVAMKILEIPPEAMHVADHNRSGNGGTAGSQDAEPSPAGDPGAGTEPAPQPQRDPQVLYE
jgi:hypothetical protein